jgi:hypothetical protein
VIEINPFVYNIVELYPMVKMKRMLLTIDIYGALVWYLSCGDTYAILQQPRSLAQQFPSA